MVQPRRAHRVRQRHAVLDHVEDHLRRRRDDARAARGAHHEQQLARRGRARSSATSRSASACPGWIAFCSPCTSPNMFGLPGCAAKSSISSFMKKPAPRQVHARAVAVVERRRRRDGVALRVDDRVVRRVHAVARSSRSSCGVGVARVGRDRRAQLARVRLARELRRAAPARTPGRRASRCGR